MARRDGKDRGLFERPKDSGIWWVRWADAAGKDHREKVGTKAAAKQVYLKRKEEVRTGKKLGPLNRRPVTVGELLAKYLPEMLTGKKPKGRTAYTKHGDYWLKALGSEIAAELRPGDVEVWKGKQLAGGSSPATVNRSLTFLRRLFTLAVRDEKVPTNPLAQGRVKRLREANPRERFFTEDEESKIQAAVPRLFWLMILVGLHTGLRRGEQLALQRDHVDLRRKSLRLDDTKAGELQHVRLNSIAVAALDEVLASHTSPWVFPGRTAALDASAVTRRFQRVCTKLKIQGASWHTLRHTFISRLAMLGTPLPTLQKLARHKSIQMTLRYAHLCPDHAEQNLEDLARRYAPKATGTKTGTAQKDPHEEP